MTDAEKLVLIDRILEDTMREPNDEDEIFRGLKDCRIIINTKFPEAGKYEKEGSSR